MKKGTIALAGNPNCGKTTFFNALTGSNQYVGNWPGVTVEKKEGIFTYKGEKYNVVDLPGTYSLGAFSEDEVVARDFILTENPDVIIAVVDANNVEKNLYLATQLLEMGKKIVVALNMIDEAEKKEIKFNIDGLSKKIGAPVVPTVASKGKGIDKVIKAAIEVMNSDIEIKNPLKYNDVVEHHIEHIEEILQDSKIPYPISWTALKIVEGDKEILKRLNEYNLEQDVIDEISRFNKYHSSDNFELGIVDSRYSFARSIAEGNVIRPDKEVVTLTDKIDKIITNKYLGIPIFALIMFLVFQLTFEIGEEILGEWAVALVEGLGSLLETFLISVNAPNWLVAFMAEGVIGGVGAVIEFVPLITVLYLLFGVLEDSGYMARAAYIWDNFMRRLGLQGKAFISMIIGFGCNVPGIMSARTLDNKRDRMIAILINPFMSCGAKIPIYSVFIAAFFPNHGGLILFGLYALGIIIGLIMAKIFSNTIFKGEQPSYFIMELPPYRVPTIKSVVRNMWDNVYGFLKRAGTTIFVVITLLWVLAMLPGSAEPYSEFSYLGRIGTFILPIFKPAGFVHWQESVALFAGIPAKEAVVGTLGLLYSGQYMEEGTMLVNVLQQNFTQLTALGYMVMVLLYTPCAATLATVGKETKSIKWPVFMALYTFAIGWGLAVIIFQVGSLLGFS